MSTPRELKRGSTEGLVADVKQALSSDYRDSHIHTPTRTGRRWKCLAAALPLRLGGGQTAPIPNRFVATLKVKATACSWHGACRSGACTLLWRGVSAVAVGATHGACRQGQQREHASCIVVRLHGSARSQKEAGMWKRSVDDTAPTGRWRRHRRQTPVPNVCQRPGPKGPYTQHR